MRNNYFIDIVYVGIVLAGLALCAPLASYMQTAPTPNLEAYEQLK